MYQLQVTYSPTVRRKIKCDGSRPTCYQCRMRPPRSLQPCQFPRTNSPTPETPHQMLTTIEALKNRIEGLELLDPSAVRLIQPYDAQGSSGTSHNSGTTTPDTSNEITVQGAYQNIQLLNQPQEPPLDMVIELLDIFLARFAESGYFFLDPTRFRHSALLALPFGNRQRPSPALLSVIFLWGCVLSPISPSPPYTEEGFLSCALQYLPSDFTDMVFHPHLIIEVIQSELLLSYYYLHAALPVQGRYHSSAAMSLALSAGLHLRVPHALNPTPFALAQPLLPPPVDTREATERTDAFWSAVILNNYWVAAHGGPSVIPYAANIDSPWPSGTESGATISKFLNGIELDGFSPVALLAKASILLERIVAFSQRNIGLGDSTDLSNLDQRVHDFLSSLPPLPGGQLLLVTHVLTNLAIVHLYAPYLSTSESARTKAWTAARRIVDGVGNFDFIKDAQNVDPIFGPLFASVCSICISGVSSLSLAVSHVHDQLHFQDDSDEVDVELGTLMGVLASLAAYSPVVEKCFMSIWTDDSYMYVLGLFLRWEKR
ncbi:hypothetical protein C8J57DRAFT_1476129 [Mycena rebaudengoi]|nr:hypothetical protein C8J57DRAFT_1476129 [Mycena rebaudengoi]